MSTEAMKLALEALKMVDCDDNDRDFLSSSQCCQLDEAITALREALAQPQQEPVGEVSGHDWSTGILYRDLEPGAPLYTSPQPAQPQQEPVAWANPNDLQNFDMKVRTNAGPLHTVPLYTYPLARKPLTDEQIINLFNEACREKFSGIERFRYFARAIEAAHGIKGTT